MRRKQFHVLKEFVIHELIMSPFNVLCYHITKKLQNLIRCFHSVDIPFICCKYPREESQLVFSMSASSVVRMLFANS